ARHHPRARTRARSHARRSASAALPDLPPGCRAPHPTHARGAQRRLHATARPDGPRDCSTRARLRRPGRRRARGAARSVLIETHSPEETEEVAARLAAHLRPGDVVTVSGQIGSGKTTFVLGACRALG